MKLTIEQKFIIPDARRHMLPSEKDKNENDVSPLIQCARTYEDNVKQNLLIQCKLASAVQSTLPAKLNQNKHIPQALQFSYYQVPDDRRYRNAEAPKVLIYIRRCDLTTLLHEIKRRGRLRCPEYLSEMSYVSKRNLIGQSLNNDDEEVYFNVMQPT